MRTAQFFRLGAAIGIAGAAALAPMAAAQAGPSNDEGPASAAYGGHPELTDDRHSRSAHGAGFTRIELTTETISSYNDIRPGGPRPGDVTLSTGYLLKGGERVGRFGNQCVFLMANAEQTLQCQETWALDGVGELTSQALTIQSATPGPRTWTSVINNGSMRFFGASGIVVAEKESETSTSDDVTIYLVDESHRKTHEQ